jgi:phage terminase large subunit GpA-like protein
MIRHKAQVKPSRSRDAGNTVLSKEFPAGLLVMTGANSAVGLRSMPARYLFLDEVDAYPPSADEEGDPVALAEARTRTFSWRSKVFLASTPTIQGFSRIEREFLSSDQQRFFVPCPHCDHSQWLQFERLRWEKAKPETARYRCNACDGEIEEHHKTAMLKQGEWRATAASTDPSTIGFHLSALYSPVGWLYRQCSWCHRTSAWSDRSCKRRRGYERGALQDTWP